MAATHWLVLPRPIVHDHFFSTTLVIASGTPTASPDGRIFHRWLSFCILDRALCVPQYWLFCFCPTCFVGAMTAPLFLCSFTHFNGLAHGDCNWLYILFYLCYLGIIWLCNCAFGGGTSTTVFFMPSFPFLLTHVCYRKQQNEFCHVGALCGLVTLSLLFHCPAQLASDLPIELEGTACLEEQNKKRHAAFGGEDRFPPGSRQAFLLLFPNVFLCVGRMKGLPHVLVTSIGREKFIW